MIAVKDCSSGIAEHMTFLFGEEAVHEAKKQRFFIRNSIFYDTKRWVNQYHEYISVTDLEGNTCEVERLFLIRQFLLHVIRQAEQQNRKWYKKLCFTCPVRQKTLFMNMYKEALPEYEILEEDVTDEAVAVVYNFLKRGIREVDYESGVPRNVLVLDCGGGTSDMVSCNYCITNEGITSHLDMNIAFVHGDTNFGGNHLTWRILQFLKIRLAEFFTNSIPFTIDELFPDIFSELYERVDREGTEKVYETFSNIYMKAESVIPTFFSLYQNQPESYFLKARGNYYFLWNMAEAVKKNIFCRPGIYRLPLKSLFSDYSEKSCFPDFHIFINKDKVWETNTICPELVIEKEEINLILKPDIYGFLKNFIEPWYENGKLMDIDRIVLSGQSSKIELFRDVLKEYVAGRKAKSPDNGGCEKKLMCIDGAVAYQQDKKTGRIRTSINHEPARVPYYLTADDYKSGKREKTLLEKGTPMGEVYNFLSRPVEAEEVLFHLKDGTGKEVFNITYFFHKADYHEIGYDELNMNYSFIRQEDLDSIKNGELRLFVFADYENWGFSILETARKENVLYSCPLNLVPFEAGAWETDFFDGRH